MTLLTFGICYVVVRMSTVKKNETVTYVLSLIEREDKKESIFLFDQFEERINSCSI